MQEAIETFITKLSQAETASDAYNEYSADTPNNIIRQANLRRYLREMTSRKPQTFMVMEAPGYRGCRLTGVPVTSRKVLLEGVPELSLFGTERGFEDVNEPGFEQVYGEQSATIVWNTLAELDVVPLIWNTFPFHPHKANQPLTNRRPRADEMRLGAIFLHDLINLYKPNTIIAVGNVAHRTLTVMGISCTKVRHPAQGGKNDFVAGMQGILE